MNRPDATPLPSGHIAIVNSRGPGFFRGIDARMLFSGPAQFHNTFTPGRINVKRWNYLCYVATPPGAVVRLRRR